MNRRWLICGLVLLEPATVRGDDVPRISEITLFIGEQRVMPAATVASYSEGAPGIVQVKIPRDAAKIVVTAVQAGRTSLLFLHHGNRQETWLITVYARPPESVLQELGLLLSGMPGIHVRQVGPRIFVEGSVPRENLRDRCLAIAKEYPDQVVSLVQVDPNRVERRMNIKLDVLFVEFSRRQGHGFGVRWPGQFAATHDIAATYDLVSGSTKASAYTISSSTLVALDLLSYWGWAKILKQSTLVSTNGVQANYLAGGELNVPVSGVGGGTLQKIPFGTNVRITPHFDADTGRIDLDVEAEASELTDRATADALPGRTLSNVKTTVHLEVGQSVMLSGMHAQRTAQAEQGWPLLREIPILGYLFKSETADQAETEGAIFITPTVVHDVSTKDRQRISDLVRRYETFRGEMAKP